MARFVLATLQTPRGPRAAIGVSERFFALEDAQPRLGHESCRSLLERWETACPELEELAEQLQRRPGHAVPAVVAAQAPLLAPILYPDKLLAVGANYSGHLREMGLKVEKWTSMPFFLRPPNTTLVGPGKTVRIPRSTQEFDWECELAVVVGKPMRHATRVQAAQAIAGYAIGLDLSCRDLIQVNNDLKVDLMRGKAQDTMAPCGPAIVPAKFVPNVDNLRIQLTVNGEKMMDASTAEMLYKVDEQLSVISEYMSLCPGDILFTGSPSGSAGVHGNRWLRPGDRIRAQIEQVGVLEVEMLAD
jgi:2-keto-4-pentenoate hydratase/2-oxohepta-3-ene-1,7-dioic acid hydratase in catechol pathway